MRLIRVSVVLAFCAAAALLCADALAGESVAEKAKDAAENIKEKTGDVVDSAGKAAKKEGESLLDLPMMPHVWAIPVVAVLAGAIGFLIGRMMGGSKKLPGKDKK